MTPRSLAIPKSLRHFDFSGLFSAFLYPALGLLLLVTVTIVALVLESLHINWTYALWGLLAFVLAVFFCNLGIGPLHRVIQHRAAEMHWPAQLITMLNCVFAMQGRIKDWVNYHSQHHRFPDQPGDPHNPHESKRWAWVGWILFRDWKELARPMPIWLKKMPVVRFIDNRYMLFSFIIHLVVPAVIYAIVWASGGSLVLTAILHACVVLGRAAQFHATTLGINVFGHLRTPVWFTHLLALFTGGEAFHDHHHEDPVSALHRPKKGIWNRIVDYNGTILMLWEKLGWVKNLKVSPQFA
jgi:stearoyl-CoA desaturase (delta-9 desaturase)